MIYNESERTMQLAKMQTVSELFYAGATRSGVHAFIEFCGLMNEFIKICDQTSKAGIDFNTSNTHMGKPLVVRAYQVEYLAEKFNCIFGPTLEDPKNREVFLRAMGWGELASAPASSQATSKSSTKEPWGPGCSHDPECASELEHSLTTDAVEDPVTGKVVEAQRDPEHATKCPRAGHTQKWLGDRYESCSYCMIEMDRELKKQSALLADAKKLAEVAHVVAWKKHDTYLVYNDFEHMQLRQALNSYWNHIKAPPPIPKEECSPGKLPMSGRGARQER